jgi:hypothetical protein
MVKTVIDNSQGLVQRGGESGLSVKNLLSFDGKDTILGVRCLEESKVFSAGTTTDLTSEVPIGGIVLGGQVEVVTANGNAVNITQVGIVGTVGKYSGTIALAANALGSAQLVPAALIPDAAAQAVRITHGAAAADGLVKVTLWYLDPAV